MLTAATVVLPWARDAHAQAAPPPAIEHDPGSAATAAPVPEEHVEHEAEDRLRIGALAGIGFPRPLSFEAMVKLGRYAAVGAEYGVLPTITIDTVHTDLWSLAGDVRVFPFGNPFFIGLRAGRQHVGASADITVANLGTVNETLGLDSWFLNPRIGVLWTSSEGLSLGVEAGLQIPLHADVSSSLPLSLSPRAQATADTLGNTVLPTVDLLKLGLLL